METIIEGGNKIVHISADWMGHELELSLEVPHWHAKLTRGSLLSEADLSDGLPPSAPASRMPSPERALGPALDKPPARSDECASRRSSFAVNAEAAAATPVSAGLSSCRYTELVLRGWDGGALRLPARDVWGQ
jgi:hypothetical protein